MEPDLYYDKQGKPITDREMGRLFKDFSYRRVAKTVLHEEHGQRWLFGRADVEHVEISTVWLGIDHGFGSERPVLFETMIFGGRCDQDQWRWCTEEDAIRGHHHIVALLRAGEDP